MKKTKIVSVALAALIIAACHTSKKSTNSTASGPTPATPAAPTTSATTTPATGPVGPMRSDKGVFAPGNEELVAIQTKYKDVTMQTLTDGYTIYTGTCTGCHGTKSIYSRSEERWPHIIDDMAEDAKLTPVEKDAVLKYVLAIKATQVK